MKKLWTPERIKEGFEQFIIDNERLPTAAEVDTSERLPSSRYIQKRFGGLEKLRHELGYTDTHLGKGNFRSNIATEVGVRSKEITTNLHQQLLEQFGPDSVQTEKTFSGQHRVDFFIHTPEGNFGIDIFYAETIRTLQSSVNIKMKKFIEFTEPLYLTVANEDITQQQLNDYVKNKKIPLPDNIQLVTLPNLRKYLKNT